MVYFITGRAGAGKTTYAKKLKAELIADGRRVVILDGDDIRDTMNNNEFDDESVKYHILTTAAYASIIERQYITVIISMIAPKRKWREAAIKMFDKCQEIYIPGGSMWPGTEYEEPEVGE